MAAKLLILLSLLAWLSNLSLNTARFDRELRALDDFSTYERGMNREVFTARAGLSRNYDHLAHLTDAYDKSLERLREVAREGPNESAAFEALAARARRQDDLVEKFKSSSALLRNSFAYFSLFDADLAASGNTEVATAANQLSAAMLRLTLDTSSDHAREVKEEIDQLAAIRSPSEEAAPIQAVLAHGGLLHDLLPATDAILKALIAEASTSEQQAIRSMIAERQRSAQSSARRYSFLLYISAVALLGVLIYLGLQLRARAVALRRRAEFEHVIASISTRFIKMPHHEIANRIEEALGTLARYIGADRAYFLVPSTPMQVYRWYSDNVDFPRGWPEKALELASRFDLGKEGVIHIHKIKPLHPYDTKNLLVEAGLRGWLCVMGPFRPGSSVILGFDALHAGALTQHGEFTLFRMAFDVIANAARRVILEREKERLEASLQQARRMETIGALASGVAHNFNNIIGAIIGHTEMADAEVRRGETKGRHLDQIRLAGERARQLTDQILTFGRGQGKREQVCIRSLVAETERLLRASLPALELEFVIGQMPESALVVAEAAQLQQVFLNICVNAAQAMCERGRGKIEIRIEEQVRDRPLRIRGSEIGPGRFTVVSISDSGHGMDQATMDRIFEPFFTIRPEGNGLGLSTAHETVLEYGGAIEVTSILGAGTRFDIWLPSAAPDGSTVVQHAPPQLSRGSGQTVMIVQPDPSSLLRDEEILAALGYEPVGFTEPSEATKMCSADPARLDAVLICPHAGTDRALSLAAQLHKIAPSLPIVLATPSARGLDPARLAASGVSELLHYPLMSSAVSSVMSRCLAISAAAMPQ
ncbi:two-component system VirA-like sensor kinase [Bradyrhizobium lablabi]|nr:two-component system VirA-like sensor kinase [Bradyrhizobium lablabi]